MIHLIIAGPPGSGKGTQALRLVETYGLKHLSTGDLFRQHMAERTPLGHKIQHIVNSGTLVPDELTIQIIRQEISTPQPTGFLFDGFPRTVPQAQALDSLLAEQKAAVTAFLLLEVPEAELITRIQKRSLESGRADDKDLHKIRTRLHVYQTETMPVASYYAAQHTCHPIQALGSIDEICTRLSEQIDPLLKPPTRSSSD